MHQGFLLCVAAHQYWQAVPQRAAPNVATSFVYNETPRQVSVSFLFSMGGFKFDCITQYRVLFYVFFINGSAGGGMMLSKLRSLDTLAFTEHGQKLSSQCSAPLFERATEGLPEQDATQMIDWKLWGETDAAGQRLLHVLSDGGARLGCQCWLGVCAFRVQ